MKKYPQYLITALTLVVTLIALNMLSSRYFARFDATDNRAYSLADATITRLRSLPDVVTARVYFTKELPPQLSGVRRAIDDMLAEYQSYGRDNFQVEYRDPQADQATERETLMLGIAPIQVNVVSNDKQEVAKVYMGLALSYGDKQESIPIDLRDPSGHLEEALTSTMVKLTRAATPALVWWGPAATPGQSSPDGEGYQLIQQALAKDFAVTPVSGETLSLDPAKQPAVLAVAHTNNVATPAQLQSLEKYLAAGGKVLLLINRLSPTPDFQATAVNTGFEPWLEKLGVTVPAQLVADLSSQYASFQSGQFTYSVPYPLWPTVSQQMGGFDRSFAGVSQLEALSLPWTSPVQVGTLPAGLQSTVLARSSERSGVTPGTPPFALDPESVAMLVPARAAAERQPLIVRLAGDFSTAFGVTRAADAIATPGELIVVGNTHMLEDRFLQQREFGEGALFLRNVLDHFTTGDELIGIRSRPVSARPIMALTETQKVALRMVHLVGVPLAVIGLGFIALWRRRTRVATLRAMYCGH